MSPEMDALIVELEDLIEGELTTKLYADDVRQAIAALRAQDAEIARMREALKAAFYEGYDSYRTPCISYSDPDEEWEQSTARAALGGEA
jgi:hypothetical protein